MHFSKMIYSPLFKGLIIACFLVTYSILVSAQEGKDTTCIQAYWHQPLLIQGHALYRNYCNVQLRSKEHIGILVPTDLSFYN